LSQSDLRNSSAGGGSFAPHGCLPTQAAIQFGVPFAVVRVISDDAGENAAFDFARFVQGVSAYYSRGVVRRLLERM